MDALADSTSGVACMIVEDNPHMRGALDALLVSEGFKVHGSADTGLGALEQLEARTARILLLVDLNLPDIGGLEVTRRAVELARRKTSVIIYTSERSVELVTRALDAGASAVVVKGASAANLLDAIAVVAAGGIYIDPELTAGGGGPATS